MAELPDCGRLPLNVWLSWKREPADLDSLGEGLRAVYRKAVEEINDKLETVGRALGHRVWQAMERYLVNHPRVCQALAAKDADALKKAAQIAFEDQLVQKVMPKLRGIPTDGEALSACLEPIAVTVHSYAGGLSEDFLLACKGDFGGFVWRGAQYLKGEK